MKLKEKVSLLRAQVQQTVLITALIVVKIIAGGIAIRGLANLPKNTQNTYKAMLAISKQSPSELAGLAEGIAEHIWSPDKWQAETNAVVAVNEELKQADKAMETTDFDKAYEHLNEAQKKWAAAMKKFGSSKESTELLNMIINLKQKNRTAKINYLAGMKAEEFSQELVTIAGRLKTIKGTEEAVDQIARLSEIQDEMISIRKDMLKLSKKEQDKDFIGIVEQLIASCDSLSKQIMDLYYPR